jgi:hypothetical protein
LNFCEKMDLAFESWSLAWRVCPRGLPARRRH